MFFRKYNRKSIIAFIILAMFIFVIQPARAIIPTAERIAKCKKILENKTGQEDVADLEKCERVLNAKVETTIQKKNILTNQVQLYNLKVKRTARNLNSIEKKVERNKLELENIEKELKKQDERMLKIKKQLKEGLILYEQNKQNLKLNLLDSQKDFTSVMNKSNSLDKLYQEINKKLDILQKEKKEAEEKKEKIIEAKKKIEKNKVVLKEEKSKLEIQRRIKNDFLVETKGDEVKFKGLLARIAKQKEQIINLSSLSVTARGSIEEIKRKADKPKGGLASTSWYYAQDDPRWANTTIGFSRTLMKNYGCAVTALSMAFTEGGEKIKPGKMAKKPMFYRDLIVWPNKWGNLKLISSRAHGNINWSKIDKQIKKGKTAIVFIRSRSGAGHYVVIHHKDKKGRYVVHDPLFGANILLETSKKLISSIYKSGVTVNQMLLYE